MGASFFVCCHFSGLYGSFFLLPFVWAVTVGASPDCQGAMSELRAVGKCMHSAAANLQCGVCLPCDILRFLWAVCELFGVGDRMPRPI
jgi:hypothetical protein